MGSIRCVVCSDCLHHIVLKHTYQAIELAAESLANVKFVQEKKLIQRYFDEISQDSGKYCFGIDDTLKALELGAVETLIVWENLDITRYVLRNAANGKSCSKILLRYIYLSYLQRRILFTQRRNRKRTVKSSWISLLDSRWSRPLNLNLFWNGLPRNTRNSARTLNSSQIALRREHSSSRALVESEVCCDTKSTSPI